MGIDYNVTNEDWDHDGEVQGKYELEYPVYALVSYVTWRKKQKEH